jgi:hypothetical protein
MSSSMLRRAREQAAITAADVERLTRLSPRIISAIEEERYELMPAGIYARTAVRAYAQAVGLDAAEVLATLQPMLPQTPLDLAALAELRTPTRRDAASRCLLAAARRGRRWAAAAAVRGGISRYILAAAADAALLLLIAATILRVCGAVCGLSPFALLRGAPGSMAILCSTPAILYFWLLGATDVRTAGPWLLNLEILPHARGPLSLGVWLRRGFLYVARELALALGAAIEVT